VYLDEKIKGDKFVSLKEEGEKNNINNKIIRARMLFRKKRKLSYKKLKRLSQKRCRR
jgi:hypothetical protein